MRWIEGNITRTAYIKGILNEAANYAPIIDGSIENNMFKVTKIGENRLDIEMSGSLDAAGMRQALDELVSKSAGIQNGMMRYDVIDFHLPSLSAIVIEFSRLPSMAGFLRKFNRAAVMTDKKWLKKISEFEGVLYPNLEIKAFNRDQVQEAEAWLSGNDAG